MTGRIFFISFISLFLSSLCFATVAETVGEKVYPFPLSDLSYHVEKWLVQNGLQLNKQPPVPGEIIFLVQDGSDSWQIRFNQHSALSTAMAIQYLKNGKESERLLGLDEYLHERLSNPDKPIAMPNSEIPVTVLNQIEAVACLRATIQGRSLQFSGFFIDKDGLILCTAHDLKAHEEIIVTSSAGFEFKGEVLKLDFESDLALIRIDAKHEKFVDLEAGRSFLGMGERVYSVGCPVNLRGTVNSGMVNGPPRRVGKFPFWQVRMEIQPGSSGSPVFDGEGNFVAVVKGFHWNQKTIGFLIPMETVMKFLEDFLL